MKKNEKCAFGSPKWFASPKWLQVAVSGKWHKGATNGC